MVIRRRTFGLAKDNCSARLEGGSDPECYKVDLRFLTAGNLPESVLTRYDLLGTDVHGRLQHA